MKQPHCLQNAYVFSGNCCQKEDFYQNKTTEQFLNGTLLIFVIQINKMQHGCAIIAPQKAEVSFSAALMCSSPPFTLGVEHPCLNLKLLVSG